MVTILLVSLTAVRPTLRAKSSVRTGQSTSRAGQLIDKKAPQLSEGSWINAPSQALSDLGGKVVLLEFWTFGCGNCRRTIPQINQWYATYGGENFTVIGVHTPEFSREKNLSILKAEIVKLGIGYPVVTDNEYKTWENYYQEYWPTIYLIDKKGIIRYIHIGEGDYGQTEEMIRSLISEQT